MHHIRPLLHALLLMTNSNNNSNNNNNNTSPMKRYYPIGTPGQPWTNAEKDQWKQTVSIQRSYQQEVVDKLQALKKETSWNVEQYGALSHNPSRYPLFAVKTKDWDTTRPSLLVTGGVHGYETSGVQGAILFLQTKAAEYTNHFNMIVIPCVSPWAYEHIQRWQADVKDPNRSFRQDVQTEESKAVMEYLEKSTGKMTIHLDLHETTDTDATEFMPAKHAEAGLPYEEEVIPDGFYLVADDQRPQLDFQKAVIERVKQVTHIAPPTEKGTIIDEPVVQEGVIVVPAKKLGLCGGVTEGTYTTTTEVYPDSPQATDEICNHAQVAAITGALDYVLSFTQ